jgi:hypothetical protein
MLPQGPSRDFVTKLPPGPAPVPTRGRHRHDVHQPHDLPQHRLWDASDVGPVISPCLQKYWISVSHRAFFSERIPPAGCFSNASQTGAEGASIDWAARINSSSISLSPLGANFLANRRLPGPVPLLPVPLLYNQLLYNDCATVR